MSLRELTERYALPAGRAGGAGVRLDLVAAEPSAITSIRDPARGVDVHVADSLVALELGELRSACRIADLGAGGGFPGLPLAIALPEARVVLVESVARKCAFLEMAAGELALANVAVVNSRGENWVDGLRAQDAVTARALAPLPVLLEYAAPLLRPQGTLVAWKTPLAPAEAADARAAAETLGMSAPAPLPVTPFDGAGDRRLYVSSKFGSAPKGYPRRPGMASKRPLKAST